MANLLLSYSSIPDNSKPNPEDSTKLIWRIWMDWFDGKFNLISSVAQFLSCSVFLDVLFQFKLKVNLFGVIISQDVGIAYFKYSTKVKKHDK